MKYSKLTASQMARVANVCDPGINYKTFPKGLLLKYFNQDFPYKSYRKPDKEKFHRICAKADAEITALRNAEWEALNRIIYEDAQ